VEFAIKDGVPYAIDFMNPAPDAELTSVGEFYHNWVTNALTDLIFKRLAEARTPQKYRWDAFLNPTSAQTAAVASSEQGAQTAAPGLVTGNTKRKARAAGAATTRSSEQTSGAGEDQPRSSRRAKSEVPGSERKKSQSSARPKSIS